MDVEMRKEEVTTTDIIWDVKTEDASIVPILSQEEENVQIATLAGYLQKGSIPQLPNVGVNWSGFLTGSLNFGELDGEIREALKQTGKEDYMPVYSINNDNLVLNIEKEM